MDNIVKFDKPYKFEGKEYDSEWEILDTLLERKSENQLNTIKI